MSLLDAAASSPSSLHRQPSIEYALFHTLTRRNDGKKGATASTLQAIVDAALVAQPQLVQLEDWLPLDPRLRVVIRWQDQLLRLHPGAQVRPVAIVERARLVAASMDSVVLALRGFTLTDLLDVSLRYTDAILHLLASARQGVSPGIFRS
jgi:hypothetical protein